MRCIDRLRLIRTTCLAALCRYRSLFDRWLIHDRMKFFVNSMGMSSALTRGSAFWNTWKPQYLRSGEDVDANSDSVRCRLQH